MSGRCPGCGYGMPEPGCHICGVENWAEVKNVEETVRAIWEKKYNKPVPPGWFRCDEDIREAAENVGMWEKKYTDPKMARDCDWFVGDQDLMTSESSCEGEVEENGTRARGREVELGCDSL